MQTFLPYPDFRESARVLDPSRLGNQAYNEAVILLEGGWFHHPAAAMWRGYRYSLCNYILACDEELTERGSRVPWLRPYVLMLRDRLTDKGPPPWLGSPEFHASHRSNLLRKDAVWYGQFGWIEPDNLEYVWPV